MVTACRETRRSGLRLASDLAASYSPGVSVPGIGRVEWLELRAVWRNEAQDFTPWLLANVDVLRDALGGLDLELERAEHAVGTFSLDLIGSDLTHGCRLIVENQIE